MRSKIIKNNSSIDASNRLITNFSSTAITNVLLQCIGLVTGILVARALGPTGRGELAAIKVWAGFIATFGTLGLHQSLIFFIGKDRNQSNSQIASLIWSYWLITIPLMSLLLVLFYYLLPFLLKAQSDFVIKEARIYLLWIPTAIISASYFSLQGLGYFKYWNFFRLHGAILYLIILCLLLVRGNLSSSHLARLGVLLGIFGIFVLFVLLRKSGLLILASPDIHALGKMLNYGLKSLLGSIPDMLNERLDQIIMVSFLNSAQLGLYAIAVTWSMILNPLIKAIGEIIFPWIANISTSTEGERRLEMSVRVSVLPTILGSVVMLMVTPWALPLIFGNDFAPAVPATMILVIAAAIWQINYIIQRGLSGLGLPEASAWSQGLGLIATVVLLYWLLPRYHILGAAMASCLVYFLSFVVLLWFVHFNTSINIKKMLLPQKKELQLLFRRLYCMVTSYFKNKDYK